MTDIRLMSSSFPLSLFSDRRQRLKAMDISFVCLCVRLPFKYCKGKEGGLVSIRFNLTGVSTSPLLLLLLLLQQQQQLHDTRDISIELPSHKNKNKKKNKEI